MKLPWQWLVVELVVPEGQVWPDLVGHQCWQCLPAMVCESDLRLFEACVVVRACRKIGENAAAVFGLSVGHVCRAVNLDVTYLSSHCCI